MTYPLEQPNKILNLDLGKQLVELKSLISSNLRNQKEKKNKKNSEARRVVMREKMDGPRN